MTTHATLHYLGWDEPPLVLAARWLGELAPLDLGQCLVAVPGGRAGRRLLTLLADQAEPDWIPPRIVTQGELVDELVQLDAAPAGRLVRTLAWSEALAGAPRAEIMSLLARPPANALGWLDLAERVRSLHAELAVEGHDFASLSQALEELGQPAEARRWRALAQVQERFREALQERDLVDPHEGRLAAASAGHSHPGRVVLVGIADPGGLLERVLANSDASADALVFAPESEAAGFDSVGGVVTAHWLARTAPLNLDRWQITATIAGEAECAILCAANRDPDGLVAFGVCDDEVTPHLASRLADAGVTARIGAGTPLPRTRPFALLQSVASFLDDRRQSRLAELVRHPDFGAWLGTRLPADAVPVQALDAHFLGHLPWRADEDPAGGKRLRVPVEQLRAVVDEALAPLLHEGTRPLSEWATHIRGLLSGVYGPLRAGSSDPDPTMGALETIQATLHEWDAVPGGLATPLSSADALVLLLRILGTAAVPPPGGDPGGPEADLLGWLELPLDDAPTLVLTGVQDGKVPQTVRGDAFLPDHIRGQIGLIDDARRMARDLYALSVLSHSRELHLISARKSMGGESLQPSRLFFHAPPDEVVARMHHFLAGRSDPPRSRFETEAQAPAPAPAEPAFEIPSVMSVTSFGRYLESPRRFYLQHGLRLDTHDDRAREMDGRLYGTLVHRVLECLIRPSLRQSTDAEQIVSAFEDQLAKESLETFGPSPMPTVRLQLAQLSYRLSIFARRQAEHAAKGWRVEHVEWPPRDSSTIPMKVDDETMGVRGTIDRLDYHPTEKRWAIWDYKTGQSGTSPDAAHRSTRGDKEWKDLQLPLYTHLSMSLNMGEAPELGYVYLGRDESKIGFRRSKLDDDALAEAFEEAQRVVRAVRAGEVSDIGKWKPTEPIFAGILGQGLLDAGDEEESEETYA